MVDWSQYIPDALSLVTFKFDIRADFDNVPTRASKGPMLSGEIVLDVPGSEEEWSKVTFDAPIETCEFEQRLLNDEIV